MFPFLFMLGMMRGPSIPLEFSRFWGYFTRTLLTGLSVLTVVIGFWFPLSWHNDFPADGWLNVGWLFTAMFMCFAAMLAIYGWGFVQIKKRAA